MTVSKDNNRYNVLNSYLILEAKKIIFLTSSITDHFSTVKLKQLHKR